LFWKDFKWPYDALDMVKGRPLRYTQLADRIADVEQ